MQKRFGDLCKLPHASDLMADLVPGFQSEDGGGDDLVFDCKEHATWFVRNVGPYRSAYVEYMTASYGNITRNMLKESLERGYSDILKKLPTLEADPFSFFDLWKAKPAAEEKDSTTPAGTGK